MQGAAYFKDLQGRFVLINRTLAKALKVGRPRMPLANRTSIFSPQSMQVRPFADEQEIVRTAPAPR